MTIELGYQCPHCPLKFTNEFGLKVHVGMRHEKKPARQPSNKLQRTGFQRDVMERFMSKREFKHFEKKYNHALEKRKDPFATEIIKFIKQNPNKQIGKVAKRFNVNIYTLYKTISNTVI
jgi:hypothetical protein